MRRGRCLGAAPCPAELGWRLWGRLLAPFFGFLSLLQPPRARGGIRGEAQVPRTPPKPPLTPAAGLGGAGGAWRAARGLQPLRPRGSRWFLSVSLGAAVGFLLLFLPRGCRRGSWLSRRWFYFHVGTREAGGAQPPQQYFLITCQKKKNKCRQGAQCSPAPAWGPGPLTRYFTRSLRQYLSRGLRRATPLLFFFILISHFKMRNKRIFNEPSQQACVCFILGSGDGGSPQGLLVSLRASAPPPQGGKEKGARRGALCSAFSPGPHPACRKQLLGPRCG